jgi:hypothetical protein
LPFGWKIICKRDVVAYTGFRTLSATFLKDVGRAMSEDHYVAQTYLRKWCDPANRDHMHAVRKSDLKQFPAHPYSVCREKNGDRIIGWLDDEMALGKFRAMFEPGWDEAVRAAAERRLTDEHKLTIAGYWANLLAMPPAMQTLGIDFFKSKDEEYRAQRAAEGNPLPEKEPNSNFNFDTHFIKAAAMDSLFTFTWQFYNAEWVVLINDSLHRFLTSDNPAASTVQSPVVQGVFRFLPLSPGLCIMMLATTLLASPKDRPSPLPAPMGNIRYRAGLGNIEVFEINRAIVVNASNLVFSVEGDDWVVRLVKLSCGKI